MVEAAGTRFLHGSRKTRREQRRRLLYGAIRVLYWLGWASALVLLGWGLATEARTSYLQSRFFTWLDHDIKYWVAPNASQSIRFPQSGPNDERLGYAELPTI